ncbi:MAG: SAM-dependent chlorinase/fluorinase [Desulfurococcales archaeon]|nr:SAM-dependent chlorinase/fluorinase [Desulfurococcales archaeon]
MSKRVVGLLSDFGEGPYAGIMRAVIRSVGGDDIDVIDIDHSIPSFNVISGAYVLAHSYYWLPKGSVIVAVVDPGVGSSRPALAVKTKNYVFIGPDNGLLFPAAQRDGIVKVYKLDEKKVVQRAKLRFRGSLPNGKWVISKTFHGRDVFAPAAALIASGSADLEELGDEIGVDRIRKASIDYVERVNGGNDTLRVQVVYVDKFGNVALSARVDRLPWSPKLMGEKNAFIIVDVSGQASMTKESEPPTGMVQVARFVSTFSEGRPNELIAYFNSFGHLELAVNRGNAAKRLGVHPEMKVTITLELLPHGGHGGERRGARRRHSDDLAYTAMP